MTAASLREVLIAVASARNVPRADLYSCAAALAKGAKARESASDRAASGSVVEPNGAVPAGEISPATTLRSILGSTMEDALAVARGQIELARRHDASILTGIDPRYPAALAEIDPRPAALFVRGDLPAGPAVAIVGSRRPDGYGLEVAALFATELARAGVTVVSGFARGIDTAAHRACLAAGGRTLAILGCGLDVDYPRGTRGLAREIAQRGALATEFPFGTTPERWRFPVRNRWIAALSSATLVIQAAPGSGSLSTAHQALDLGRDVFAVPGRIFDELSLGTNGLLREGAHPAQHPADLLEALGIEPGVRRSRRDDPPAAPSRPVPEGLGPLPRALAEALSSGTATSLEALVGSSEAPLDEVLAALLDLELCGFARRLPGPSYQRTLW